MSRTNGEGIAAVFVACRKGLARAVRQIVRRHDVDDVLQEAFVRSFEAEGRHPIHNARAFLMRTARNVALDHVTRASYRTTERLEVLQEAELEDDSVPHDAQVDAERRFIAFCEAVGSLPEQCRKVFVLKKVYGLSLEEISVRLGIAESTVEKHVARGLQLCFERMGTSRAEVARKRRQRLA